MWHAQEDLMELALFIPFAALALAGGLGVIASRRAIHSAGSLVVGLSSLAGVPPLLGGAVIAARAVRPGRGGALLAAALFLVALLTAVARPRTAALLTAGPALGFGTAEAV